MPLSIAMWLSLLIATNRADTFSGNRWVPALNRDSGQDFSRCNLWTAFAWVFFAVCLSNSQFHRTLVFSSRGIGSLTTLSTCGLESFMLWREGKVLMGLSNFLFSTPPELLREIW